MNLGLFFDVGSAMVLWWLFVIFDINILGCNAVMNVGLLFKVKSAMVFLWLFVIFESILGCVMLL